MKTPILILILATLGVASFSGCAATATRESTGEYIDNTAITAKVKAALVRDELVSALDVSVETFRGVVQLSGFVDTQAQKDRAAQVARSVEGVTDVKNNLVVK
jgi:osmotically-inducible protein OsmY